MKEDYIKEICKCMIDKNYFLDFNEIRILLNQITDISVLADILSELK